MVEYKFKRLEREHEWRECPNNPSLGFPRGSFKLINQFIKNFKDKDVCVLGSGDNFSSFVLAGLGADVTSVDISQEQLNTASERAKELNLDITFIQGDATECSFLEQNTFDFVCSTNGFYIWISDLTALFKEIFRILKPNGYFMSYDIHPFLRPWREINRVGILEMEKPYFSDNAIIYYYNRLTGEDISYSEDRIMDLDKDRIDTVYEHHWTLSDLLNPMLDSGLCLLKILEEPAERDFYDEKMIQDKIDYQKVVQ